ncbi:MAG: hypothetical protein A3E87_09510 [Gammaproteobacteria bacterium RIFCSPHIGHO2_12_FULL_35_23]|nr:MAG: hypothetical protein A3E87_09510 [Gammaproteobacteria bacterium RIFCSPHIGHO2_12_FULL_35_23]
MEYRKFSKNFKILAYSCTSTDELIQQLKEDVQQGEHVLIMNNAEFDDFFKNYLLKYKRKLDFIVACI